MQRLRRLTRPILVTALLACSAPAMADGRPVHFGVGQKIVHVASLSDEMRAELGPNYGPGFALGFGYQTLALAGLDIWTWDGGFCIYAGDVCDAVSAERSAEVLGVAAADLGLPWSYRLRPGLILLGLAGVLWYVLNQRRRHRLAAQPSASDDPRYQRALELVMEGTKKLPLGEQAQAARDQFSLGVDYLVENGVAREEASNVLVGLVDTVLDFRRRTANHR